MKLLEWHSNYSVGVAAIDDEHREMIELINDVYARLVQQPDAEQVDECLGDIFDSISMHFALEERLMLNGHYPDYAAHKADHEALLDQLRDLMDLYYDEPEESTTRLQECLSSWFAIHFSTFDAQLHGKLKSLPL